MSNEQRGIIDAAAAPAAVIHPSSIQWETRTYSGVDTVSYLHRASSPWVTCVYARSSLRPQVRSSEHDSCQQDSCHDTCVTSDVHLDAYVALVASIGKVKKSGF